ncbi:MAG: alpha/beta hydrolase, partial [bacterium]|nr:alpha/beta hydrolase [bacterium]
LRSGYVQVGRLVLHHVVGGRGSPPVLFVHGLGSAGFLGWRFTLPTVAAHRRIAAPDLPGFGLSDKPDLRYGVPLFARTLARYIDRCRLGRPVVVGASMGGRVALELAFRHPGKVSRVVLVNSLGLGFPRTWAHGFLLLPGVGETLFQLTGAALHRMPPDGVRRLAARLRLATNPERTLDDLQLEALREIHADGGTAPAFLTTVRSLALRSADDVLADLPRLGVPLRLIWGVEDPLFPVGQAERAHRLVPGSRLRMVDGAGHTPEIEQPERFLEALLASLDD